MRIEIKFETINRLPSMGKKLSVPDHLRVQNLVDEIARRNELRPKDDVFLTFNGQVLAGHKQLSDCGIVDGSVINVHIREPMLHEQKARVQLWIQQQQQLLLTTKPQNPILKKHVHAKQKSCNAKVHEQRAKVHEQRAKVHEQRVFIPVPLGMGKHIVSALAIRSTYEETAALALLSL